MIDVTTTCTLTRSPDEVFSFVADQTNAPRWQQDLAEVRRTTDSPIGVGTEHEFVRRFAGRRVASRNRFVTYEPGRFVAFEILDGWVTGRASYLTQPLDAGGTLLTSRVQLQVSGWGARLEPVLGRLLARDSSRDTEALRRLLDGVAAETQDRHIAAVERWGWLSGVTGAVANGLLLVMFAQLAAEPDGTGPWMWTGPANDAIGAMSALAGAPMILALTSLTGPSPIRYALAWLTVPGATAMAGASVLLLLDATTLEVQTAVALPYIASLFAWLHTIGTAGTAQRVVSRGQAKAARTLARLLLAGMATGGAALLLPSGSVIQKVGLAASIGLGAGGFLGYPFWQMRVSRSIGGRARRVDNDAPSSVSLEVAR